MNVCVCVSLRQPQRTMAFAGMLSDEDIQAAIQACQGESDNTHKLACREKHTLHASKHKHKSTYFTASVYMSIHIYKHTNTHAEVLIKPTPTGGTSVVCFLQWGQGTCR